MKYTKNRQATGGYTDFQTTVPHLQGRARIETRPVLAYPSSSQMAAKVGTSTAVVDASPTLHRRSHSDKKPQESASSEAIANGTTHFSLSNNELKTRKYKHVFAIHSQPKTSCLSHESVEAPSFLGFRNLMVLVLSGFSPIPNFKFRKAKTSLLVGFSN